MLALVGREDPATPITVAREVARRAPGRELEVIDGRALKLFRVARGVQRARCLWVCNAMERGSRERERSET